MPPAIKKGKRRLTACSTVTLDFADTVIRNKSTQWTEITSKISYFITLVVEFRIFFLW
tara:strand:- start:13 stop:186 length:174 start_codon:yes stop_codon:yes gene_type:complete